MAKRKSTNSFAALESDSDTCSGDEGTGDGTDQRIMSTLISANEVSIANELPVSSQQFHCQAGGSVAMRIDPIVGLDNDKTVDLGIETADIDACYRVIEVLAKNSNLFKLPAFKKLRAALHPLIMEQLKSNYQTTGNAFKDDSEGKRGRKRRKMDGDEMDRETRAAALETEYINQTQLRAVRMQQLESLNADGFDVPRVPDGVALITNGSSSSSSRLMLSAGSDRKSVTLPKDSATTSTAPESATELREPISCYICHKPYRKLHFFYHQLCPECAAFNYSKRDEMADMRGKVCLVTGARQKIGFRCALKLLRCGATLIATTRFPVDATQRFIAEPDSKEWVGRLHVYGVDFRNLTALEWFCSYVISNYDRLDAIVNNAAQTVRRPPAYYAHLLEGELMLTHLAADAESNAHSNSDDTNCNSSSTSSSSSSSNSAAQSARSVLRHQTLFASSLSAAVDASGDKHIESGNAEPTAPHSAETHTSISPHATGGVLSDRNTQSVPRGIQMTPSITSSDMTQIMLTKGDDEVSSSAPSSLFPLGATDVAGQQVDLRTHNSWTMRLHEVSTPELAEVFSINAIAPAIINARLKPLMERDSDALKFIVNVSAMEGKFYRFKSANHPHTNMAKASLNMMTRTSAQDYVKSKIYMTAVDTGWINDEKPVDLAVKHHQKHNFQTPIDELDAASRVLDPIIAPLLAQQRGEIVDPPWGFFLKDYQKCEW